MGMSTKYIACQKVMGGQWLLLLKLRKATWDSAERCTASGSIPLVHREFNLGKNLGNWFLLSN